MQPTELDDERVEEYLLEQGDEALMLVESVQVDDEDHPAERDLQDGGPKAKKYSKFANKKKNAII